MLDARGNRSIDKEALKIQCNRVNRKEQLLSQRWRRMYIPTYIYIPIYEYIGI